VPGSAGLVLVRLRASGRVAGLSRAFRDQPRLLVLVIGGNSSRAWSQNRCMSAVFGSSPLASMRARSCPDRRPP
jgi:hypothetical protein